jgi:hypothetical protein
MMIPFKCGNWSVDEVHVLRGPLCPSRLSLFEVSMLRMMAAKINVVIPMDKLIALTNSDNSLKVHIHRLRAHLKEVGADSEIRVAQNEGYMLYCEAEIAICPTFTLNQWHAIQKALIIAEKYEPGITDRAGLST